MAATNEAQPYRSNLATVPFEKGFHFCTEGGNYTGVTATSLSEFTAKLQTIDEDAITFHMGRGDFEAWIRDLFGDEELAWKISQVNPDMDNRRDRLIEVVNSHINYVVSI